LGVSTYCNDATDLMEISYLQILQWYIHIYNHSIGHRFYWGPTESPVSLVLRSHFLRVELAGVRLATDLHLVLKLIRSVAIPPFRLVCAVTTVPLLYFECHINLSKDKHV
jgi:hypothetical protein